MLTLKVFHPSHLSVFTSLLCLIQVHFMCSCGCYEGQTGLHSPLGVFFCSARDVPLDLSLVHAVHGQPHHCPAHRQGPKGIALSWVRIKAHGKTSNSAFINVLFSKLLMYFWAISHNYTDIFTILNRLLL